MPATPRETTFGVLRTGLPVTFRQGVAGTWDDLVPHDPLPKWLCPSGLPAKGTASLVESRCKELRPSCTPAKGLTLWTLSVGRCPSPPRQRARPLDSAIGLRPTRANAPASPARPCESFVVAGGHLGASASHQPSSIVVDLDDPAATGSAARRSQLLRSVLAAQERARR